MVQLHSVNVEGYVLDINQNQQVGLFTRTFVFTFNGSNVMTPIERSINRYSALSTV
ncbi:MAG: hypothetical protein JOZ08_16085 [Verrucomicrobia bacterium]|nr:hypothetical protein [Verrucomicrobiota bacterium]MBV8279165.1 hypothetical protein [Verrucomicrobiota bacterium]